MARRWIAAVVGALSLGVVPGAHAQVRSLYERVGRRSGIEVVVRDFTDRALADDRINAKFARSDTDHFFGVLVQQLCAATGGPCKYTGRNMKDAHEGMAVTDGEFDAMLEDFGASMDRFEVGPAERQEMMQLLGAMRLDVVEVKTGDAGTPLPAGFKPWAPPPPPPK
jgi:hemoglobin